MVDQDWHITEQPKAPFLYQSATVLSSLQIFLVVEVRSNVWITLIVFDFHFNWNYWENCAHKKKKKKKKLCDHHIVFLVYSIIDLSFQPFGTQEFNHLVIVKHNLDTQGAHWMHTNALVMTLEFPRGGHCRNFWVGMCRWGLEPLTFTRASSAEFCYPILE